MTKPNAIDIEQKLSELEIQVLDELAGTEDAADTYSGINALMRQQEAAQRALKPGLEPEHVYTAGQVPPQPGNVWNSVDRTPVDRAPPGQWTGTKLAPE